MRRLSGLADSYRNERDRLIDLLPEPLREAARERLPAFQALEIQALTATSSALHGRALKLKEGKIRLLQRYRIVVLDNSMDDALIRHLNDFENDWGTFAGGFLHRANFDRFSDLEETLQVWEHLYATVDLLHRQNENRETQRKLDGDVAQAFDELKTDHKEIAEILSAEFAPAELSEFSGQFNILGKQFGRIAAQKLNWFKRVWLKLLRRVPLGFEISQYQALNEKLGVDPLVDITPLSFQEVNGAAAEYATACQQAAKILEAAEKQRRLGEMKQEGDRLGRELERRLSELPNAIRQDLKRLIPIRLEPGEFLDEIAAIETGIQALRAEIAELVATADQKLVQNSDHLEMLAEFQHSTGNKLPGLAKFDPQDEIEVILQGMADWRNLIVFWDTETKLRNLERQLDELPNETLAIQAVQKASADLLSAGGEILRKIWELRSRQLPSEVVKGALDYVQAVEQLSQGYNPALFHRLKQAEEENFRYAVRVFPVWATTNLAAKTNFPLQAGYFDLVIIDEASQCDVPSALPLLFRAKRIIVIGDPNQLRHVATLTKDSDQEAAARHGVALEAFSYNGHSLFDLAHRGVGSHPGYILLKEHYRSDARIIGFSNRLFYNDELVIRTDFSLRNLPEEVVLGAWRRPLASCTGKGGTPQRRQRVQPDRDRRDLTACPSAARKPAAQANGRSQHWDRFSLPRTGRAYPTLGARDIWRRRPNNRRYRP